MLICSEGEVSTPGDFVQLNMICTLDEMLDN